MPPTSIDVLVPFWGLAGGVIKILDYADHAAQLGLAVRLWAPPVPDEQQLVHSLPVAQRLLQSPGVEVLPLDQLALDSKRVVLFTEPTHHELIERAVDSGLGARLIHLVQGTRHANPRWHDGRNYRLLHRPMTRISVSHEVTAAIGPLANTAHPIHTIVEGHDGRYFAGRPDAQRSASHPRVLYTTWKSDLGDRVRQRFEQTNPGATAAWIAIREPLGWPALRNRYHGADIFLCAPGPEEGFYLPGLEAMAAGTSVVTALVGGNAAYVRAEVNALVAQYEDVDSHVAAVRRLMGDSGLRDSLAVSAVETVAAHTLARERHEFASVLSAYD